MRNRRATTIAMLLSVIAIPALAAEAGVTYRSPECGCCEGWVSYMKGMGYEMSLVSSDAMDAVKDRMHVPADLRSCHTAVISGYVIEGHVPAEAIAKLLSEKSKVTGIAAPGMPMGSPGMPGEKEPFAVYTFGPGGETPFMTF